MAAEIVKFSQAKTRRLEVLGSLLVALAGSRGSTSNGYLIGLVSAAEAKVIEGITRTVDAEVEEE
jgi:hypothetical protein